MMVLKLHFSNLMFSMKNIMYIKRKGNKQTNKKALLQSWSNILPMTRVLVYQNSIKDLLVEPAVFYNILTWCMSL